MTMRPSQGHFSAEAVPQSAQSQLRGFIAHAPSSMALLDRAMNYLATSNRWIDDYGRGRTSVVGLNHYDLLPDLPPEWRAVHQRGMRGETIKNDEERWLQADGSAHWLRWSVQPWHNGQGEVGGIVIATENITERMQVVEELRQSEYLRAEILDSMAPNIAVIDANGVITAVNAAWSRFAFENSDAPGKPLPNTGVGANYLAILDAASPHSAPESVAARDGLLAVLAGAVPQFGMEYPCHSAQQQRWFYMSATPLARFGTGLVISHTDITEQKLAVAEAQKKQQILDALLATFPEGITIVSAPGLEPLYTSSYAEEMLLGGHDKAKGMTIEDWLAKIEHYLPDGRTPATLNDLPLWRAAVKGETVQDNELTLVKPNGQSLSVLCNAGPIRGSAGNITGGIITWRDITARKAREKALQDANDRLAVTQLGAHAGIWSWDLTTGEVTWSDELFRLFGLEPASLSANYDAWRSLIHPEDLPLAEKAIQTQIAQNSALSMDYRIIRPGGEVRWMQAYGNVVGLDDGTPTRLCGILIDITERKATETALEATRSELHEMVNWQVARHTVAAIAHELHQPLASIMALAGAVALLSAAGKSKAIELRAVTQRMVVESERAADAVRHLMGTLRAPNVTATDVSIDDLLQKIVRNEMLDRAAQAEILLSCPPGLPLVRINAQQVEKVVKNLIRNSMDAMHAAGMAGRHIWISVRAQPNESALCVTVLDDGPGVAAELATELFQPFVSTKADGLGLGLAVSRSLIQAQGGRLWHEAHGGVGAKFLFSLPIAA